LLWRLRAGLNIMYQYKPKIATVVMITAIVPAQNSDIPSEVHARFRR